MSSDRVPRLVRKSTTTKDGSTTLDAPEPLGVFRDTESWILLGEPGAGKTTVFEMEAQATGGLLLPIREFIKLDPQPDWSSKPLFLDGLDEVRAIGDDSILLQVRNRLSSLGNPPFRLSCRAADWLGETDSKDLGRASSAGPGQRSPDDPCHPRHAGQRRPSCNRWMSSGTRSRLRTS
jgi:hypothetical protein